jgi:hypothetical protein
MAEPLPFALLGQLAGPADGVDQRVARAIVAHPAAADALEPLGELLVGADCDVRLRLRRGGVQLDAQGVIGPAACVLVAPAHPGSDAGWWQVASATGLARLVAAAVGLGPRGEHPHPGALLPIPAAALEAAAGVGRPASVVAELRAAMAADGFPGAAVEAILGADALYWTLVAIGAADAQPAVVVSVVDTDDHGLWLVGDGPDEGSEAVLLIAVTPTDVWRVLCRALAPAEAPADVIDGAPA